MCVIECDWCNFSVIVAHKGLLGLSISAWEFYAHREKINKRINKHSIAIFKLTRPLYILARVACQKF